MVDRVVPFPDVRLGDVMVRCSDPWVVDGSGVVLLPDVVLADIYLFKISQRSILFWWDGGR